MLSKKNNSYVLKLYDQGTFQTEDKIERPFFVVDYSEKRDLYQYVKASNGFGERYGKLMFKKILEGIQFCHKSDICHMDIKVENILLDDQYNPIINDFGLSLLIVVPSTKRILKMRGTRGTKYIMCPQMWDKVEYNGLEADIFALGVLLYELVFNVIPFEQSNDDIYKDIRNKNNEKFWGRVIGLNEKSDISPEFRELYVKLVAFNPKERPRIKYILQDPWFDEINKLTKEEYKKLEDEFLKFMKETEKKINGVNQMSISPKMDGKDEKKSTKGISFSGKTIYFEGDLKPKKLKDKKIKRIFNYYIKINEYINEVKFMNSLVNKIVENFGNGFFVKAEKNKLKFIISYEGEGEEEEEEEKKDSKKVINKESKENEGSNEVEEIEEFEDEDDRINFIMDVELYECEKNEYLLSFDKKQGDLKGFYDSFLKIEKIIIKMLS